MSLKPFLQEPERPTASLCTALGNLKEGEKFIFDYERIGTILRVGPGYPPTYVQVKMTKGIKHVKFEDRTTTHDFYATDTKVSEWSSGTPVVRFTDVFPGGDVDMSSEAEVVGGTKEVNAQVKERIEAFRRKMEEKKKMSVGVKKEAGKAKATAAAVEAKVTSKTAEKAKIGVKPPKAKKAKVPNNPCACGCGVLVLRRFKASHDATHYARLRKVIKGELKFGELPESVRKRIKNVAGAQEELSRH